MTARDRRIENNLRLVHACAGRFRGRGIEYEDLFQAGCMGLVKAVDAFDESRGVKLSTYAVPVILGEIKRLFRDGGTVKVSRSIKELGLKLTRLNAALQLTLGRDPTISEVASAAAVPEADAVYAMAAMQPALSLTVGDEDANSGRELQLSVPGVEEEFCESLSLDAAVSRLEDRDRKLIKLRYYEGKTQVETARVLDMTQVQVSRREKKILFFLKEQLRGSG